MDGQGHVTYCYKFRDPISKFGTDETLKLDINQIYQIFFDKFIMANK